MPSRTISSKFILPLLSSILLFLFTDNSFAKTPEKSLWPRWKSHNPEASASIDHTLWDKFVKKYIRQNKQGVNLVKYKRISRIDYYNLQEYVDSLTRIDILDYNRAEQLAFWINLYNALTIKLILEKYPVGSIREINISPGLFNRGPWDANLIQISKSEMSLNDIEHRILRPIWDDPLIHYGLSCAAIGCPNLQTEAFTAKNTKQLLQKSAREFINSPRGVLVKNNQITASKMYQWYQQDFGQDEQAVIEHWQQYANPELKQHLEGKNKINKYQYDWSLNNTS